MTAATPAPVREELYDDAIVLRTDNTTVGYARFSRDTRIVEYIFVNPAFRRRGVGRRLVSACERACGGPVVPAPPLSPLGARFFASLSPDGGPGATRSA